MEDGTYRNNTHAMGYLYDRESEGVSDQNSNPVSQTEDYLNPVEGMGTSTLDYLTMKNMEPPAGSERDSADYEEIKDTNILRKKQSLPHTYLQMVDSDSWKKNRYENKTAHGISVQPNMRTQVIAAEHSDQGRKWKITCIISTVILLVISLTMLGLLLYTHFTVREKGPTTFQEVTPVQDCVEVPCFQGRYCNHIRPSDNIKVGCLCTQVFLDSRCSIRKIGPLGAVERDVNFGHKDLYEKNGAISQIDAWDYAYNHLIGIRLWYGKQASAVLGETTNTTLKANTLLLTPGERITKVCTWSGSYPVARQYYVIRQIKFETSRHRSLVAGGVALSENSNKQCTPDINGYLLYIEGKAFGALDSVDFIFKIT